jgi:hypothetical protein
MDARPAAWCVREFLWSLIDRDIFGYGMDLGPVIETRTTVGGSERYRVPVNTALAIDLTWQHVYLKTVKSMNFKNA